MHGDNNNKYLELTKRILKKIKPRFSFHYVAYTILFTIVVYSVVSIVTATTPNPGHPWSELGDGVFVFTNSQTVTPYTYTFPAANTTVLTTNAAVTVGQGGTGLGTVADGSILATNTADVLSAVTWHSAGTKVLTNASGTISWEDAASGMVWPAGGAGIPNYSGSSSWGTSYTTSGSGTVLALATSPVLTTPTVTTSILPSSNDGATLGAATTGEFSDLFLASGGVINWAAGNATLTHSTGLLTSNVPLSLGTSNSLTAGTIELGAASDTTISRSGAGAIQVEGVQVLLSGAALGTPTSGTLTNATGYPWDHLAAPGAALSLTMPAGDETTFTYSATTQTGLLQTSSTLTSGMIQKNSLTGSSVAASAASSGSLLTLTSSATGFTTATQRLGAIYSTGANSNASVILQGLDISVANTGTTNTNQALRLSASGGSTTNIALDIAAGELRLAGSAGTSGQILISGGANASPSWTSTPTVTTLTTTGDIELGAATDTTIHRSGAGAITVEGVQVLLSGAALGTPTSGTVTNLTGTASININGTVGATTPTTGVFTTATTNTGLMPDADDGAYLGQSGTAFSDLFLASGGVINWAAGNATLTHSTGLLTSNVPLSLGTSNALTAGTIELGAASDTTIARSGAGAITVEGVQVLLSGAALGTPTSGTLTNATGYKWNNLAAPTAALSLTFPATDETTFTYSATTQTGLLQTSSTLTSGMIQKNSLTGSSVAASAASSGSLLTLTSSATGFTTATQRLGAIYSTGANSNASVILQGLDISVANTGTTNTNQALRLSASGGSTTNIALDIAAGELRLAGSAGTSGQILISGGANASPSWTSTPTVTTLTTTGDIELGAATDTTIHRVSAGVVSIEGSNILVSGGALGTPSSGSAANLTSFPTLNQDTTGSAVYWKTSGTGKGAITGPAVGTTRTYTFPDADSTILYSGGALGTPSSGTVTNLTGTASININGTVGATTPTTGVFTTATTNTGLMPDADDGAYLGQSGTAFSDLFLASGGVINWAAGNATLTHSTGLLTSNVPLSLGTSNSLTAGTIELGAASDTTISRSGAGAIQVEGVQVLLSGAALGTPTSGTLTNATGYPWDHLAAPGAALSLTMPAGDETTFTYSATTQTGLLQTSSTLTSGMIQKNSLTGSSVAASAASSGSLLTLTSSATGFTTATQRLGAIYSTGANSNASVILQGLDISVANTGTTNTNQALRLSASGGSTTNIALDIAAGELRLAGSAGTSGQILISGGANASPSWTSTPTVTTLTTTGDIELGAATDTTIHRSGAGAITVEGVQVLLSGAALGTPTSGTVTNLTGTASININGTVGATTPTTGVFTTATTNTGLMPDADDGAYLGQSGTAFSDLFLASGGVINWAAGNATLTHSTGLLTSNVPLSLGTSNSLTAGTIELGAASDTTISRSGAGAIQVEGVQVLLSGAALGTPTSGTLTNATGYPWDHLAAPGAALSLTMPAGDETTFTYSATTQTGLLQTSSTLTSGMIQKNSLTGSSVAASAASSGSLLTLTSSATGFTTATQRLGAIYSTGANSNASVILQGLDISVANTGTTNTNQALRLSASGGSTTNIALDIAAGELRLAGSAGTSGQILISGGANASPSWTSTPTVTTLTTTGDIELGAATDTTIHRSGAGAITVEGVQVLLSGAALGTPTSGTLTNATGYKWNNLAAPTAALSLTIPAGDETTFTYSATTQTGLLQTSSTLTSGMIQKNSLTGSSVAASAASSGSLLTLTSSATGFTTATQRLGAIYSTGANSNASVILQGLDISVANTGTTNTNQALRLSASGGSTTNIALDIAAGELRLAGSAGTSGQILISGGANASPSWTSTPTVTTLTTTGDIELGAATDTTIHRVSAGVVSIEGSNILVSGGALGTPSSGTVTNLTGTASININGTVGATTPTTGVFTTATTNTGLMPDANDGAYLGQAGTAFSDLFLAEGGVINWDSGDVTLTQTGNELALAGGDFVLGANNLTSTGRVLVGATSDATSSSKLYLSGTTAVDGSTAGVIGALGNYTFNPSAGGTQVGNRFVVTNSPTSVANTAVGEIVRIVDGTSLANLVRGIDITANAGGNTAGINTGLRANGATFGVQGLTTALGAGSSVPAALYGESTGTDQGDVLRLYSTSVTSAPSFATFYHSGSTFTGTGLLMDFATGSGAFNGNFADFQKNNTSVFKVTNGGIVSMGLSGTASTTAVCSSLGNSPATPAANTAYEIRDCSGAPVADYAEMYPVESSVEYGDIVAVGDQLVDTYDTGQDGGIDWTKVKGKVAKLIKSNEAYQKNVIGIISDNNNDFSSTGYNIKEGDNPKPVALSGRVPVKISGNSESIQVGDYLTTSTDPGKATKAIKAGQVIGKALETWNPGSDKNTVMVYVEQGYQNGESMASLTGLSVDSLNIDEPLFADKILEKLMASQNAGGDNSTSEIFTDRLIAGLDIITPSITTNNIKASGEVNFNGLAFFGDNVDFAKSIKFNDVAEFAVPPLFNSDTAGFAIIKKGSTSVQVSFDNPYLATPVVATTITFDKSTGDNASAFDAESFFGNDIKSVVAEKDQTGFMIELNKPAPQDVNFSWIALAVRDPKIFESAMDGLIIDEPTDTKDTTKTSTPKVETQAPTIPPTDTSPTGSVPAASTPPATSVSTTDATPLTTDTTPTPAVEIPAPTPEITPTMTPEAPSEQVSTPELTPTQ